MIKKDAARGIIYRIAASQTRSLQLELTILAQAYLAQA
jgi:hypothetical protein